MDGRLEAWKKAVGRSPTDSRRDLEYYHTPLLFAPGESWMYGTSYDWAGQLLEHTVQKRLGEYMQEHIFKPLGMSSMSFWPSNIAGFDEKAAAMAQRSAADGTLALSDWVKRPSEGDIDSGGGGLYGSAADYAKFLQALLQGGRLIDERTMDELFAPQLDDPQQAALKAIAAVHGDAMLPEFEPGTPINHGLAGVINTEDVAGKRRGGSMAWAGMLNSRWVSTSPSS